MDDSSDHTFAPSHEEATLPEDTTPDQDDGPGITIDFQLLLDARISNRLQQYKG